jgi:4-carboxymuconolactone decarboxylase
MRAGIDPNFGELTAVDETGSLIGPWNPWLRFPKFG